MLYNMRLVDPKYIFDSTVSKESVYSLVPLLMSFPMFGNFEEIESQYRVLQNMADLAVHCDKPIDEFWKLVGEVRSGEDYLLKDLATFGQAMLSLPHSSAEVERVFSKLNVIKTKLRNRLLPKTCESLLLAKDLLKENGGVCYSFFSKGLSTESSATEEGDEVMLDEMISTLE